MKNKRLADFGFFEIIVIFIVISVVVIIFTAKILDFVSPQYRDIYIAIIASICGGCCTLFGVLITIKADKQAVEIADKKKHIPELYVANRYDISETNKIRVVNGNESIVPNISIYLKNTDKNSFSIISLNINDKNYIPISPSYVDKNDTFCVSCCCLESVNKAILLLRSVDNHEYSYLLEFEDDQIKSLKRMSNYVSNQN